MSICWIHHILSSMLDILKRLLREKRPFLNSLGGLSVNRARGSKEKTLKVGKKKRKSPCDGWKGHFSGCRNIQPLACEDTFSPPVSEARKSRSWPNVLRLELYAPDPCDRGQHPLREPRKYVVNPSDGALISSEGFGKSCMLFWGFLSDCCRKLFVNKPQWLCACGEKVIQRWPWNVAMSPLNVFTVTSSTYDCVPGGVLSAVLEFSS